MPNLQTFSQQEKAKRLSDNGIRKPPPSENSAKLCKSLSFLQTFLVKPLLSPLAGKTVQMRTGTNHPNRKKHVVFAKNLLLDYSINSVDTGSYEKRKSSLFRRFSQKCELLQQILKNNSKLKKLDFYMPLLSNWHSYIIL